MIKVIEGDLLSAKEHIIAHQCNCFTIRSGIAKQITDKYYQVYTEHKKYVAGNHEGALGHCQFVPIGRSKYICNMFGQYKYGYDDKCYTDYNALESALQILKYTAKENNLSVALPFYLGCGRGNGDMDKIHNMIDKIFSDGEVTLYKREE